jgi:hypothetical protein
MYNQLLSILNDKFIEYGEFIEFNEDHSEAHETIKMRFGRLNKEIEYTDGLELH